MLKIRQKRLPLEISRQHLGRLKKSISELRPALIESLRTGFLKRLHMPAQIIEKSLYEMEKEGKILAGDIFLHEEGGLLYYTISGDGNYLEVGGILTGDSQPFDQFVEQVDSAIISLFPDVKRHWEEPADTFPLSVLREETIPIEKPEKEELLGSNALRQEETRKLLQAILEAKNIFLDKLFEQFPSQMADRTLKILEKTGLINKDFVVICRKTNQQILRFSSRKAIEEPSQRSLKCTICGNPISQEKIDEIIACSPLGEKLLKNNLWLTCLVISTLLEIPLEKDKIRMSRETTGKTHLFIQLDQDGILVMLNSGRISLEDTHEINAHLTAYKLPKLVIISDRRVPSLIKGHLERSNPDCFITYIESLDNLENQIKNTLVSFQRKILLDILSPLDGLTRLNLHELLLQRFPLEEKTVSPPAETPEIKEELEKAPEKEEKVKEKEEETKEEPDKDKESTSSRAKKKKK